VTDSSSGWSGSGSGSGWAASGSGSSGTPSIGSAVGIAGILVVVGDAAHVVIRVRVGAPMSWRQATVRIVVRADTTAATANVVGVVLGIGARQRSQCVA